MSDNKIDHFLSAISLAELKYKDYRKYCYAIDNILLNPRIREMYNDDPILVYKYVELTYYIAKKDKHLDIFYKILNMFKLD